MNGLKSCVKKGFESWLDKEQPDIVCLQETKYQPDMLSSTWFRDYHLEVHAADKPGYSGVAILVKDTISDYTFTPNIGVPEIDSEARVLTFSSDDLVVINVYAPHSHRTLKNLEKKENFGNAFINFLNKNNNDKPTVIVGDFNVAYEQRDLSNYKQNVGNAGFHQSERQWFKKVLDLGYLDAFRELHKDTGHFTWWSLLPTVRERNVGWRLDYILASKGLKHFIESCYISPNVYGSDHCPVTIELNSPNIRSQRI